MNEIGRPEIGRPRGGKRSPYRRGAQLLLVGLVALAAYTIRAANAAGDDPCTPPVQNPIVCENSKPGNPPSEWDVQGSGDSNIQGFATDISVDQGQTVHFKVDTNATDYRLDIYRMGYYGGDGARKVATVQPSASLPQTQPACLNDDNTGLIDCGNWSESASWAVPADAVSGIYFAKLVREDGTPGESHIYFVVRDDDGNSDLLFQTSDTTWEAYNQYGGNSLYAGGPGTNPGRAYKVSYNRPFTTRGPTPEDAPFNAEYPMVRWLERNGYDVSYFTGVDADRRGSEILDHQTYMSVGHDEYWSGEQRANVEAARDAGVNLAFFSGNEIFWKTRWENSIDGSDTPHRTLVSYKETHANAKIDPHVHLDRDVARPAPVQPRGRRTRRTRSAARSSRSTAAPTRSRCRRPRARCASGATPASPRSRPARPRPSPMGPSATSGMRTSTMARAQPASSTYRRHKVDVPQRIQDYGSNYGPGTATHSLTEYRASSGALVFGAGTVQWSWGLDGNHDRGASTPDRDMQQATVNLLADMGIPSRTTCRATSSPPPPRPTRSRPPHISRRRSTAPTSPPGKQTTITGTATDGGGETGGQVAGVEVSVDGGSTWHPAQGRGSWSYSWTPGAAGSADDQDPRRRRQRQPREPGRRDRRSTWRRGPAPARSGTTRSPPADSNDSQRGRGRGQVPLRRQRLHHRASLLQDVRQHRHPRRPPVDGGRHPARHRPRSRGESASGWQEVDFGAPVPIDADTTYIASYHAPNGHYAASNGYFANGGFDSAPLHALGERRGRAEWDLQVRVLRRPVLRRARHVPVEQLLDRCRLQHGRQPGHDTADDQRPLTGQRRQWRRHRRQRHGDLQRGDGRELDQRHHRSASRSLERGRCRERQL